MRDKITNLIFVVLVLGILVGLAHYGKINSLETAKNRMDVACFQTQDEANRKARPSSACEFSTDQYHVEKVRLDFLF